MFIVNIKVSSHISWHVYNCSGISLNKLLGLGSNNVANANWIVFIIHQTTHVLYLVCDPIDIASRICRILHNSVLVRLGEVILSFMRWGRALFLTQRYLTKPNINKVMQSVYSINALDLELDTYIHTLIS